MRSPDREAPLPHRGRWCSPYIDAGPKLAVVDGQISRAFWNCNSSPASGLLGSAKRAHTYRLKCRLSDFASRARFV